MEKVFKNYLILKNYLEQLRTFGNKAIGYIFTPPEVLLSAHNVDQGTQNTLENSLYKI